MDELGPSSHSILIFLGVIILLQGGVYNYLGLEQRALFSGICGGVVLGYGLYLLIVANHPSKLTKTQKHMIKLLYAVSIVAVLGLLVLQKREVDPLQLPAYIVDVGHCWVTSRQPVLQGQRQQPRRHYFREFCQTFLSDDNIQRSLQLVSITPFSKQYINTFCQVYHPIEIQENKSLPLHQHLKPEIWQDLELAKLTLFFEIFHKKHPHIQFESLVTDIAVATVIFNPLSYAIPEYNFWQIVKKVTWTSDNNNSNSILQTVCEKWKPLADNQQFNATNFIIDISQPDASGPNQQLSFHPATVLEIWIAGPDYLQTQHSIDGDGVEEICAKFRQVVTTNQLIESLKL